MKTALQLYTIRDCITDKASLFSALEIVSSLGYEGVEFAGFFNAEADELKQKLAQLNLTPVSCHIGGDLIKNNLDGTLNYLKAIACKNIALAWYDTKTVEKTKEACELIKIARTKAEEMGIKFYYHNHDHEFYANEGVLPIDAIKKVCDLELDTFWVLASGREPVKYLQDNKEKIGLVHLKDGSPKEKKPCALGEGENDIKAIYNAAKNLGYDWIIIENDNPVPNGIEDITRSINYLKSF